MDADGPRKRARDAAGRVVPQPNSEQEADDIRSSQPNHNWRNPKAPVSYRTAVGGPRWLTDDNSTVVFSSTIPLQAEQPVNPRCPLICFSEEELQSFHKPWSRALVVKVLERSFAFPTIKRRLETLWAKHGQIQVTDASNAFFIVRFSDPNDYQLAAFRGPWKIYDYYITVARWSPDFDETALIRKVLTWIRLPKLPIQYFNNVAVSRIGDSIGRTVRLDLATEEGARGRFARVCVEVDLSKPLLGKYMIKNRLFYIEYESLDNICTQCGVYGHKIEKCPELVEEPGTIPTITEDDMETAVEEGDVGPWMTVTHRKHGRRNRHTAPPPNSKIDVEFRPRLLRRGEVALDLPSDRVESSEILPDHPPMPLTTVGPTQTNQESPSRSQIENPKTKPSSNGSFTIPIVPASTRVTRKDDASLTSSPKNMSDLVSVPVTYINPVFQSSSSPTSDREETRGRQILSKRNKLAGKHHSVPPLTVQAKPSNSGKDLSSKPNGGAPTGKDTHSKKAMMDHASKGGRPPDL
ncbi:hypothetical protein LINGRAHAP2_LOCUS12346 [Linum grandiflorum]